MYVVSSPFLVLTVICRETGSHFVVTLQHLLSKAQTLYLLLLLESRRQAGQVVGDSPCILACSGLVLTPFTGQQKQAGQVVSDLTCNLVQALY